MLTWPAVGHTLPLIQLAEALAKQSDVVITLMTATEQMRDLRKKGIWPPKESDGWSNRVRLVGIGPAFDDASVAEIVRIELSARRMEKFFPDALDTLLAEKEIMDNATMTPYSAVQKPTMVIVNWMVCWSLDLIRKMAPGVPVLSFFDNAATFIIRMLGPREVGGFGSMRYEWEALVKEHGYDANDVQLREKLCGRRPVGKIPIPGVAIMEEAEQNPQSGKVTQQVPIVERCLSIQDLTWNADGMIINTCDQIEKTQVEYIRSAGLSKGKPVMTVGPLLSADFWVKEEQGVVVSSSTSETISFLDKQKPTSTLYISFGTIWYPNEVQIRSMVNTLLSIEPPVPFIWSFAKGADLVPKDLQDAIAAHPERGMLVRWAPQLDILRHPSTAFFLTHGGWNSAMETIASGIPTLVIPFFGDQVFDTAVLEALGVGFEIRGARSRGEFSESFMDSLKRMLFGEEGKKLVQNAVKLRKIAYDSVHTGSSRADLLKLVELAN